MNNTMLTVTTTVFTVLLLASSAFGGGDSDQPISEKIQERMLERFGEEGIDADNDGVLSREEVRAFRADRQPTATENGFNSTRGARMRDRASRDAGRLFHRIDVLNSETAPEVFNIDRAPEADVDGDGVLSDAEWVEFAQQKLDEIMERLVEHNPAIDVDADGTISDEELESFRAEYEASIRDRILSDHPEADADGDGTISDEELEGFRAARKAERIAWILERHPEADVDGDAILSDDELNQLHDSMFPDGPGERGPRERRGRR